MATKPLNNNEYLAQYSAGTVKAFQDLRKAVGEAGPIDAKTCELIALGGFATARLEGAFKVHAKRAKALGATAEEIRHAVLVTLGATTTYDVCITTLRWVDEAMEG